MINFVTSNSTILIGTYISIFAIGWGIGRTIKTVRQFFDHL